MRYFGRHLTKTEESQNKSGRFFKNCVAAVLRIKFSSSHPHTVIHKVDALLPDCGGSKNECDVFSACVCEYATSEREPPALGGLSSSKHVFFIIFVCAHCHNKQRGCGWKFMHYYFQMLLSVGKVNKKVQCACWRFSLEVSSIIWIWRDVLNALYSVLRIVQYCDLNKSDGGWMLDLNIRSRFHTGSLLN